MERDPGAADDTQGAPGTRVLLVVGDASVRGGVLPELRRSVSAADAAVRVVAPALAESVLDEGAGDLEEARAAAEGRLHASLQVLRRAGIDAEGEVGDSELAVAVADAVARFDPSEVLVATRPLERSALVEQGDIEQVRSETEVPVVHVVVDPELGAEVVGVERDAGGIPHGEESAAAEESLVAEEQPVEMTEVITDMSGRAWLGLGVGTVGTAALIGLGIDCAVGSQTITGGCGLRMLLAIAASIILFWHVIALVLMNTVKYRGPWHDLVADTLLFGIPPAVLVSFLLD